MPYLRQPKILIGFNDLQTTHPELAKEADGWDPRTVVAGSNEKYLWRCPDGHLYPMSLIRELKEVRSVQFVNEESYCWDK